MPARSLVNIGRWKVSVDTEATRAVYAKEIAGGDACHCDSCQSYASVRAAAIPPEGKALLEALGIDPMKEEEVLWGYPVADTPYRWFDGWFHFIGEVIEGAPTRLESLAQPWAWENVTDRFRIGITPGKKLPCFEGFRKGTAEAIEFDLWVREDAPGFRKLRGPAFLELDPPAP